MKCTNKITKKLIVVLTCTAIVFNTAGCGKGKTVQDAYNINSSIFGLTKAELENGGTGHLLGASVCIANEDIDNAEVDMSLAEGAGLFNISSQTTAYAKNIHERLYPASTTKILTAYLTLKYGNLDDTVTMTAENVALDSDASNCGLEEGDTVTVEQLLYGLMLVSANEAANALADYISGGTEEFAVLMNQEAAALGATNSHFVNANGLHEEDHYTTVYDLYLIFNAALQNETFREIIGTKSYTASYTDASGQSIVENWDNVMQYYSGKQIAPDQVTVLGGKTGTTNAALSCLVLLSENESGEEYVSIILKSRDRGVLYEEMNDLLEQINK